MTSQPTQVRETALPGCKLIRPFRHADDRGELVKAFHADTWAAHGMATDHREWLVSVSEQGVLRGLHFQVPPADHAKLVACVQGRVLDVVVDLRRGSPTFAQSLAVELDDRERTSIHIPSGLAHGFLVLSERAIVSYLVTTTHSPEHDGGIRWDSVGVDWPCAEPVLSDRDRDLPTLAEFDSPFEFGA